MTEQRHPLPVSGIILCGGNSSRMGTQKAFLPYGGSTLIEHRLRSMQEIFCEIFLVTNSPADFEHLSANVVKDIVPARGPLVGILSGLLVSVCEHAFVSACDMPMLDEQVMLTLANRRKEADILLYRWAEHVEPLLGMYSKRCIPRLEQLVFGARKEDGKGSFNAAPDAGDDDILAGLTRKTIDFASRQRGNILPPHFSVDTPTDFGKLALNQVHLRVPAF